MRIIVKQGNVNAEGARVQGENDEIKIGEKCADEHINGNRTGNPVPVNRTSPEHMHQDHRDQHGGKKGSQPDIYNHCGLAWIHVAPVAETKTCDRYHGYNARPAGLAANSHYSSDKDHQKNQVHDQRARIGIHEWINGKGLKEQYDEKSGQTHVFSPHPLEYFRNHGLCPPIRGLPSFHSNVSMRRHLIHYFQDRFMLRAEKPVSFLDGLFGT